jgi:DNA-binding transcriptional MerR regulator
MANNADAHIKERKWLTLGLARAILGINETTLRHWADHGLVRAFRTPGGHRRFSIDDINSLIEQNQQRLSTVGPQRRAAEAKVLPRIRRKVQIRGSTTQIPAWMLDYTARDNEQMRILGRELLELCAEATQQTLGKRPMQAAQRLGNAYASEAESMGVTLQHAIQAFVFFRTITLEAIRPTLMNRRLSPYDLSRCWMHIDRLTDEVLLSMTNSFGTYLNQAVKTRKQHDTHGSQSSPYTIKKGASEI